MTSQEWRNVEKDQDPDYIGSLSEALGLDNVLCPVCESHLRKGICLNGCHLGESGQAQFQGLIRDWTGVKNES